MPSIRSEFSRDSDKFTPEEEAAVQQAIDEETDRAGRPLTVEQALWVAAAALAMPCQKFEEFARCGVRGLSGRSISPLGGDFPSDAEMIRPLTQKTGTGKC